MTIPSLLRSTHAGLVRRSVEALAALLLLAGTGAVAPGVADLAPALAPREAAAACTNTALSRAPNVNGYFTRQSVSSGTPTKATGAFNGSSTGYFWVSGIITRGWAGFSTYTGSSPNTPGTGTTSNCNNYFKYTGFRVGNNGEWGLLVNLRYSNNAGSGAQFEGNEYNHHNTTTTFDNAYSSKSAFTILEGNYTAAQQSAYHSPCTTIYTTQAALDRVKAATVTAPGANCEAIATDSLSLQAAFIYDVTAPSLSIAAATSLSNGATVDFILTDANHKGLSALAASSIGTTATGPVSGVRTYNDFTVTNGAVTAVVCAAGSCTITVDPDADGEVTLTSVAAPSITDEATNAQTTTFGSASMTSDTTAPAVSTFALQAASDSGSSSSDAITNDTTPTFDLTFSEAVSGLAAGDITTGGTASCTVTGVTATSASVYTVATNCTTSGTLVLTLGAGSVSDAATNAGPVAASSTATVTIDTTAPSTGAVSLSESAASLRVSGTTLFYSAAAGGAGFTASLAPTGATTVLFPEISGLGTGATNGPSTDTTDPYSFAYLFGTGALTASGAQTVTASDAAGNTASATFTLTADLSAPSITWTTPAAGTTIIASTASTLSFSMSDGSGSGEAVSTIQRQRAAISIAGTCAGVGWADDGAATTVTGTTSLAVSGLLSGYCYRWTITSTDAVGNAGSSSSGGLLVDTTAPSLLVAGTGTNTYQSGTTIYVRSDISGTLSISATALDAESEIVSVTFGTLAPAGWTPGQSLPYVDSSAPFAVDLDWSSSLASTGTLTVTARNGADVTTQTTLTLVPDETGPTAAFSAPSAGTTSSSSTSITATWTESDGAGVASRSLQRQRATIPDAGTCAGATFADDGAATTGASPRTDSSLPSAYCYRYALTLVDNVGNSSTTYSGAVLVDTTAPATPTASVTGAGAYLAGTTLWFRPGVSGDVTITATSSDAQSGVSAMRFAGTPTAGWTATPTLPSSDPAAPFAAALAWTAVATGDWTYSIDAQNGTGAFGSSLDLVLTADGAAPVATFSTPAGGSQSTTGTTVDWTETDGAGSGIASRSLQRERAAIATAGSCTNASFSADGSPSSAAAPYADSGLLTGYCYRYVLTLVDRVGNTTTATSSAILVDTTAPSTPDVTASGSGVYQAAANDIVYLRPSAAATLTLSATAADGESGLGSITFGALAVGTGYTPAGAVTDSTSPYSSAYLFTAAAVSDSLVVSATNGSGVSGAGRTLTLTVDATAPTATFTTPDEGTTASSTNGAYSVAWSETETGSGVASRSLQRQRVTASGASCPASGWADDGSALSDASPVAVSGLLSGYCYRWVQTLTDNVGNSAASTSGSLLVDSSAPNAPSVVVTGPEIYQSGTTIYYGVGAGDATITATATDTDSGIAYVTFGSLSAPTGYTPSQPLPYNDTTSPYSLVLNLIGAAGTTTISITATNGVATESNATTLTLIRDSGAPVALVSLPAAGTTLQAGTSVPVSWTSSDNLSGISTASLQRERVAITTAGACAGTGYANDGAATSVTANGSTTVSGLAGGYCYRWTLTVADKTGATATSTSGAVLIDTTAPTTPDASASGAGVYQASANGVVYFRSGVSGTISIGATASDAESAVAHIRFAWASGAATTGFTPSAALPADDSVAPYAIALDYGTNAGSSTLELVARNGAGTDGSVRSLTLTADAAGPTVVVTAPTATTLQSGTGITVTWTESDALSGVAGRSVQRYRAAIPAAGSCADASFAADGAPTSGASPLLDTGLATGSCYRYGITASDRVGNASSETFTASVLVDTTAPDAPTLTLDADVAGKLYTAPGGTIWFRASSSGTITLGATATDAQSGISLVTYAALVGTSGWSPTSGTTTTANPAAKTYTWSSGASTATFSVTAANGSGGEGGAAVVTLTADAAAPSISWTSPEPATTIGSGASTVLIFSATDAGSGVASTSLQRERVATVNGACPASGWATDGAAVSNPVSPLGVSGLATGYCYRWVLTATDQVGQEASDTSGSVRIDTSYGIGGVPAAVDFGAGEPGDLIPASSFTATATASGAYEFRIEVDPMTRVGGGLADDVIPASAFRFSVNGVTYYPDGSGVVSFQSPSGTGNLGTSYVITPYLLLPFVSTGSYGGALTFVVDGIGQ